jgi:DsbC/DsbD-like thiol-disulfide interchange protein
MGTIAALALVTAFPLHAEKPDVRARIIVPASLPAGARTPLSVELTVGPGWHVNSHTPSETFLIPTDVALTTSAGTLSSVRYPPHVERRFSFSEKPLRVYEGTVRFETDLELPAAAAGDAAIAGSLSYQACNDQQCYSPAKIPLESRVAISSR